MQIVSVDIGSTWTKAALFTREGDALTLVNHVLTPTTTHHLAKGFFSSLDQVLNVDDALPLLNSGEVALKYSSSAKGGLAVAAMGLVPSITLETAKVTAHSAGAKIAQYYAYKLNRRDIQALEETQPDILLFTGGTDGGEESYGFLPEDFVRDKDSVSSISLMAEIAAWAKDKGMTMYQMLQDIYIKYGYSKEKGISVVRKGKSGAEEIVAMMKNFRENPMKELDGSPVILIKDYASLEATDMVNGTKSKLDMPVTSNVLQYFSADGSKVSIRPSGTEPKIKFYIEVRGIKMDNYADYDAANAAADAKIEAIKKELGI